MSLKEKLGEEGYAELMEMQNPPSQTKAWLIGAVKSWTTWFGGALVALPALAPDLLTQLQETLTPNQYRIAAQVIGFMVILLRVKTTASLVEKGKPK